MKLINALKAYNWKIFVISFIAGFMGMMLVKLGVNFPKIISPLVVSTPVVDVFQSVRAKLKGKPSSYRLNSSQNLFSVSADYSIGSLPSYIVVDYDTGNVLAEKNSSQKLSIASLTKIMSSIVALDLLNESELLSVSKHAAGIIPTKIGVVPGEKMSVRELLHAVLLTSANDATEVIREGVDKKYGENTFVRAMNEKAKFLGLANSHFDNPQGFDSEGNYSSAADLTVLSHYALENYPLIAQISKKDYQFLPRDNNHKQFDLYNWQGLIGVYPNVLGLKIGNTDAAGVTTVVVSERDGKKVLAVVLGAQGILERDLSAAELLNIGFEKTAGLASVHITEEELRQKYATWNYWN